MKSQQKLAAAKSSSHVIGTGANRQGPNAGADGRASSQFADFDMMDRDLQNNNNDDSDSFDEGAGANGKHEFHDYTQMVTLKPDHEKRPIWIAPDGKLFLEAFSPLYKPATDFLIAIAEPVSRPKFVHEYVLTPYSLYAAVSVGLSKEDIFQVLDRLSKNAEIPQDVQFYIDRYSSQYGKAKLVLKDNRYFIEAVDKRTLRKLLEIEQVNTAYEECRQEKKRLQLLSQNQTVSTASTIERLDVQMLRDRITNAGKKYDGNSAFQTGDSKDLTQRFMNLQDEFKVFFDVDMYDEEENAENEKEEAEGDKTDQILGNADGIKKTKDKLVIEIASRQIEEVKESCIKRNFPLIEEYDFKRDSVSADLKIELKSSTQIRSYQEQSLSKMFSNGRARSGIIVLPCGAGKTLTGIVGACTIKKSTIVLCTSGVAVEQWRQQFFMWSSIGGKVVRFTSKTKDTMFCTSGPDKEAGIVISTYNMVAYQGNRSADTEKIIKAISQMDWGLMILDEVQVVPAEMFRKVLAICKSHCKLGLTATLVREDQKIDDLNFLIGPKLYEANWLDLQESGFLARVQCIEVWCEMTPEFYKEYLTAKPRIKMILYVNNPNKFLACQYLINLHESRGDKIIVFSDNLFALKMYAKKLKKPFISGDVSHQERMGILHYFQKTNEINTIFISKVGDTSIDLPGANVIIQISSHFGARRQEAQRLGRILRPKQSTDKQASSNHEEFNAYFYSLVSTNTQEMYYADKRQQFLIDQGYYFEVIQELPYMRNPEERAKLMMSGRKEQVDLLTQILQNDETKLGMEEERDEFLEEDQDQMEMEKIKRKEKAITALTGADSGVYDEYSRY